MALEFKTYEGGATLESLGTVLDIVGKDGKIALMPKNFKDLTKRVAVLFTKKNGQSVVVSCSAQVSSALRNGSMNKEQLIGMEVLENEEGIPFISMPSGQLVEIELKSVKVKDFTVSAVSFEDLIAL